MGLADTACRRDWHVAHERVLRRLARALGDCGRQLAETEDSIDEPRRRVATTREIFDDLVALSDEFGEARIDAAAKEIFVVTDSIALDGLDLGRFRIVLNWSQIASRSGAYHVESADGRTSGVDEDVIHPHVRDGALCEGDGRPAILAALASGRILDFFTIVARTLATYNAHNAFLTTDRWHGVACSDCDSFVDEDDRACCELCESDLCGDCATSCADCGRTSCGCCRAGCAGCQDDFCSGCVTTCRQCRRRICKGCQHDGSCQECRDGDDETGEEPPGGQVAPPPAAAEADALCVGQADVSA
jgi:hypothetical protein